MVIWLQPATVFWLGGGTISLSCSMYKGFGDVRQTEIHTAETLVAEPSAFEVEMVIEKLKNHISPAVDQIPPEFVKVLGRKIRPEFRKPSACVWNIQGVTGGKDQTSGECSLC